jgi:hypothetical protein
MNKGLSYITKGAVYLMGIGVFSICAILLPELAREEAAGRVHPPTSWPFLLGAWVLSIPIFIALYQTFTILRLVDANKAFSHFSVKALQIIKVCAVIFGIVIMLSAITVVVTTHMIDPTEDTPPILMIGMIFMSVSIIIATFVGVLQRLLQDAIRIKSENDLTV